MQRFFAILSVMAGWQPPNRQGVRVGAANQQSCAVDRREIA